MQVEGLNGKLVSSTAPTEVVKTSFHLLTVSSENKIICKKIKKSVGNII